MSVTRLGVAGLGGLGEALIKDVKRSPGLQLMAVQDVRHDRALQIAASFGVPWSGDVYDELIERADVDAVVICTPNALHARQAQAALRRGKDVLVQKPLAVSCADAQATAEVASEMGRLLFVDYTYRFLETMGALEQAVGRRDEIRSVRAAFHNVYGPGSEKSWFYDAVQSGGGALMDLGVHLLDLGLWLVAPEEVELERAELSDARPVEHAAQLRLRLDAIPFVVDVSWNAPLPGAEISFEVELANTRLRWENVDGSFFHFRSLRDSVVLADRETTLREDTLRVFVRAVAERRAPPIDLRVYEILDRAYAVRSGAERLP